MSTLSGFPPSLGQVAAFEALVSGASSSEFCIIGAPAALSQFAQHLRYVSRADWAGSEPMRTTGPPLDVLGKSSKSTEVFAEGFCWEDQESHG